MAAILDQHECDKIPDGLKILKSSTQNDWVIAKTDGYGVCETSAWQLKYCPYCARELK